MDSNNQCNKTSPKTRLINTLTKPCAAVTPYTSTAVDVKQFLCPEDSSVVKNIK